MSETPCRECRAYEEPVADSNGFCREHQCHVPVSCRGCDDFAKRRDRWEEAADEVGKNCRGLPGVEAILRRHFPPADKAAVWDAVNRTWEQCHTREEWATAITDAVLAALEGGRDEKA